MVDYLPCFGWSDSNEQFTPTPLGDIFGEQRGECFAWVVTAYRELFAEELCAALKPKVQTVWIVDDDE